MISIKNTLISEDLLEKEFVCDLSACKGACCVEGDGGAPLDENELNILEDIYEDVKPFMNTKGIQGVKEQGKWIVGEDGGKETPILNGKECVYVFFEIDSVSLGPATLGARRTRTLEVVRASLVGRRATIAYCLVYNIPCCG